MVPPSIEPEGQELVEARLHVSNPGGSVPLRELLQNASDAVLARRVLEPSFGGSVEVRISADLCELTVCDDGVGMGADVLAGALLDLGRSLWRSPGLAKVHPGLLEAEFEPAGRFGIGFFSVFAWADQVQVISRPRNESEDETRVLVFSEGLKGDPLLREAQSEERLAEAGTQVRLRMRDGARELLEILGLALGPDEPSSPLGEAAIEPLVTKLRSMAPAYEVDLRTMVGEGEPRVVVSGGDWQSVAPDRLLARVAQADKHLEAEIKRAGLIGPAEKPRGRIGFSDPRITSLGAKCCALVEGGLCVGATEGLVGVLEVARSYPSQSGGRLVASPEEIADWATQQARANDPADGDSLNLSAKVLMLGGDLGPAPLAESAKGPLTRDELLEWIGERRRIVLVDTFERFIGAATEEATEIKGERLTAYDEGEEWEEERTPWFDRVPNPRYELSPDALNIAGQGGGMFRGGLRPADLPAGFVEDSFCSVEDEVMYLAATAWNCEVDEIEIAEEPSTDDEIEVEDYGPVVSYGTELIRPRGAGR